MGQDGNMYCARHEEDEMQLLHFPAIIRIRRYPGLQHDSPRNPPRSASSRVLDTTCCIMQVLGARPRVLNEEASFCIYPRLCDRVTNTLLIDRPQQSAALIPWVEAWHGILL